MRDLTPDESTLGKIHGAAAMFATQEEIAGLLQVSKWQFQRFMADNAEARHAYDTGMATAKLRLRKFQWIHAEKNHGMAIFLGKNYLGQRDIAGEGEKPDTVTPANDSRGIDALSVDELVDLERLLDKTKSAAGPRAGANPVGGEEPSRLRKTGLA